MWAPKDELAHISCIGTCPSSGLASGHFPYSFFAGTLDAYAKHDARSFW